MTPGEGRAPGEVEAVAAELAVEEVRAELAVPEAQEGTLTALLLVRVLIPRLVSASVAEVVGLAAAVVVVVMVVVVVQAEPVGMAARGMAVPCMYRAGPSPWSMTPLRATPRPVAQMALAVGRVEAVSAEVVVRVASAVLVVLADLVCTVTALTVQQALMALRVWRA
jgi:hypothetical protein